MSKTLITLNADSYPHLLSALNAGADANVDIKNHYPHFADADNNSNIRTRIFTLSRGVT
jgi:hypothetical protein